MTFQPRDRWVIQRVSEAFELDAHAVEDHFRDQGELDKLRAVYGPDTPRHIFIYHQSEDSEPGAKESGASPEGPPNLVVTQGDSAGIRGKACYLLRNLKAGERVDVQKACDTSLVFGETTSSPLHTLEALLSKVYQPLFHAQDQWGKAEKEQVAEFRAAVDRFTEDMENALKSLVDGLELRKPDAKYDLDTARTSAGLKDEAMISHFETLLNEWCEDVEKYIRDEQADAFEGSDAGPMTELEFWRFRQQRLTSITEQLKSKECKTVIAVLNAVTKTSEARQKVFVLLRRWKQIDIELTEKSNEAKDNVKYLYTLERFIEPLYSGTPTSIIDTLPALMNSIKMIHTIARYYNTTERMTNLFVKITNQMITNCKQFVRGGSGANEQLWDKDSQELVSRLEACLKLNEAYQEQYRITREKLLSMPKSKQFDFSESQIFGKFDLFCRRVIKLIDMFSTIHQFQSLADHKLEGMEDLIEQFFKIIGDFRMKHDELLDYHNNKFDRDYVEFNVQISDLETHLQGFINQSFESITSISHSLSLLRKFQAILQRESLKTDLDSKFNIIFQNYGVELEQVQTLYEKHKHAPPLPRNMPPVAGNITWSRHLLKRIEEPMKRFESNQNVLNSREAKRIIKTYNKVARTLVAFEYLWYQAWCQSIDTAKAGLQATLIIRHPDDGKLYVNFDQEILQLIREAKCLDRMGIEIPESAKIVLLQEDKFKSYFNDLQYALREYERVLARINPYTSQLLRPHINDMEYKLRPGMITLTWTSMNIDAYKHHIHTGLQKLEELVNNCNDIIENRIEKNLKIVSKTMLVDLPADRSFALDEFVSEQQDFISRRAVFQQGKNVEIENAVDDLLRIITAYPLDAHIAPVREQDTLALKRHYNTLMYQALLQSTKNSLHAVKKRVGSRTTTSFLFVEQPFFEVDVRLDMPSVRLSPSLVEIQEAINKAAKAVLRCSAHLWDWGQQEVEADDRSTFFTLITKDMEIVRTVLLLTGSIQGLKNEVASYLASFSSYEWLWKENKDAAYKRFMDAKPALEDYEQELRHFVEVEAEVQEVQPVYNIGALSLNTKNLKLALRHESSEWKVQYSSNLHQEARRLMNDLTDYMKTTSSKLNREVNDLDSLRFVMEVLKEIRERESGIEMEITPILDMYQMLERFLPADYMGKDEMDLKSVLQSNWRKLVQQAEGIADDLSTKQKTFKKKLLTDIKTFVSDVQAFRADFEANGPMVAGVKPMEAVQRLQRYKEEFEIRQRKFELYRSGEELFALKHTEYPELEQTSKELKLLDKLYTLYMDVINTFDEWQEILWVDVVAKIDEMSSVIEGFAQRCKKMPGKLRTWEAYQDLKKQIEDFQTVLPLLQELSKESIRPRHWQEVMKITGRTFQVDSAEFKLATLLEANLVEYKEDIEEVTEGADKQLNIQTKLEEIKDRWAVEEFEFMEWKTRSVPILKGVGPIVEELEEAQLQLQTMLTLRHVTPFREEVQEKLSELSDTSETLELWVKVQMLWCSLESVFTGGDIAKQMPLEAKKFSKIDKDWVKVMNKAAETRTVVPCCSNELLRSSLPVMYTELEKCQKSLEGYLEQKRNKFPRFYFVSNPVLLQILSQGSDPQAIQPYYEKIFDAIDKVVHNKKDRSYIEKFLSRIGTFEEVIPMSTMVKCQGNIEDWLMDLLVEQQRSMKDACRQCAAKSAALSEVSQLWDFVCRMPGQFALLGIQLIWTADCQEGLEQCRQRRGALMEKDKRCDAILREISGWSLEKELNKMERVKVETLVTIQVHNRDIMSYLVDLFRRKQISDANDFQWLKQSRFYWRPDKVDFLDTPGACLISITDVDFEYQYEYLGCKERLVITPLTDRCYITLAQAMGMYFGGAPAGPAGTGKTESVKDMGRSLGIYVVVTNCTDQMRYTDCGKIFKGLCQAGLWGCFDEFNRILLPVLSVVAQQVLAILNAKKAKVDTFQFPGEPSDILLNPMCGFFITMNPGYAGRQELPENLKALFRGVAMMVPDFEIIISVKLCSVGYQDFVMLAKKFFMLYKMCKEQLSKQKHYDFGLRNILSVLRTAGATKRHPDNSEKKEIELLYRTLRDMNLSKLVAQDVPLFLSLLKDLFPGVPVPPKGEYPDVERAIKSVVESEGLVHHDSWVLKVIQFFETTQVRHGIMLTGPAGGGKTRIIETLLAARAKVTGIPHKQARINPKAVRAAELYGEVDAMSGEWTTGVFAAMWAKYNNRANKFNTWMVMDGPVDTIWIEDLNTVLDDNRILTLANGDRIPMTDNCLILFENENLNNASPATVSRCGIIFVSDTDLDWVPVIEAWVAKQPESQRDTLRALFTKYIGECTPKDPGHMFNFLNRRTAQVMATSRVGKVTALMNLMDALLRGAKLASDPSEATLQLEKVFVYALLWSVGGLLEPEDRARMDGYLRQMDDAGAMPQIGKDETAYEYYVDPATLRWEQWRPPSWKYPQTETLDFSNLLVPTMDSTRAMYLLRNLHAIRKPVLMVGGPGTAKTSCALMFIDTLPEDMLNKRVNFSSATTPGMFQTTVEGELEKRGGKSFGPPSGKKMTVLLDDLSMPLINEWGDQPTLEIVRQLIESDGFCFLDKDKRGDFKTCEDLYYVAAMNNPGGGKNDIPNRFKRHFFIFNMVLPSITSIDDIYGQMLAGRFPAGEFSEECLDVVSKLTRATIQLWTDVKKKMLPTPAKFHYVFNMRELSRVFQGVLLAPKETITEGGSVVPSTDQASNLLALWKHECERVFGDKLTNNEDKEWLVSKLQQVTEKHYGKGQAGKVAGELFFVDFMREETEDEEGVPVPAEKVYENGQSLPTVREKVWEFLGRYNEEFPSVKMDLVLFDDALRHLIRISRVIGMPRGSALLVGVGGSGKQSLTRLASFIAGNDTFQITLTKSYGRNSLMDDLRELYDKAGHLGKQVTFLFTDAEIKQEAFLEFINSILMTGEVAGLFLKEEMMGMCADIRDDFVQQRPGQPDTPDNLKQFFTDRVRDNLHLVLCMSPMSPKFAERARFFPGIISGCTIDWFLPWPEEALVAVSRGFVANFEMDTEPETRELLMTHMGKVHRMVVEVCDEYFSSMRRHVYQTPKSYLSFIQNYQGTYEQKLTAIKLQEGRVNLGLQKLIKGAEDVEAMKLVLADEQVKLEKATEDTNKMLGSLEVSSMEAKRESEKVSKIKTSCEADAARIEAERERCAADLAKAQPFVDQAETAIQSIKPAHINEIKKLPKPSDIIKLVFDGVCVLFMRPLEPVKPTTLTVSKKEVHFIEPSFSSAQALMSDTSFLKNLFDFGANRKDKMNEETIELLSPYIALEGFTPEVAKSASAAAEGLCTWVQAMKFYHEASKIVKPKLEALAVAQTELDAANKALAEAQSRLDACNARLKELKDQFEAQMAEKQRLEDNATKLQNKLEMAEKLINGLAGERVRWSEDSQTFAERKRRLVGDCAVACAFVSYAGPFNQEFRDVLVRGRFIKDCVERGVPVTKDLKVTEFLVDIGTVGDWTMQGLPTDPLSVQNGILVTRRARYPLLVDPQGQALKWIANMERERLPHFGTTTIGAPKLKDQLEFAMAEGKALIITGVEEDIDPMLDPVLERRIVKKARTLYINVADKMCEYDPEFSMYFITRLPNPHFTPELQAKTTLIDFTVTRKGLEEQLLGRVIAREQKALEEQLNQVLEEVTSNTKSLLKLDAELLERLSSNEGNLLDDVELIGVLANTKEKAADVKAKLEAADETRRSINEKREQFRPVATRGSVLYFAIVEMSNVNVMYQTSLDQFLALFMRSMDEAEKATLANKRVANIIGTMTYITYRYINRGLYERHKLLFVFIVTLKVLVVDGKLSQSDVMLFLRGGAALDISSVRAKPFKWMSNEAWLNVIQMSQSNKFFAQLPDDMQRNESLWQRWYEDNEPEHQPIPDYDTRLAENKEIGPFLRMLLVRSLRMDRTLLVMKEFVRRTPETGEDYVKPVTDTMESIFRESVPETPTIFLLSTGADPTESLETLAKKKKQHVKCVSMGEGQEVVAKREMTAAATNGTWVLLQNCELGLDLMVQMEEYMEKLRETMSPEFRLFVSAMPDPKFPLGLLQMCTKVTNEPPAGLRAGMLRSFTVIVDQERLERIDTSQWRIMVYGLCFLHSIVQERRKFGPLGWNIPYEFNNGDLTACLLFLEKHLYAGTISWPTVQYMVAEAQYGGKITDDMDRRLFTTYAEAWVSPRILQPDFTYNPSEPATADSKIPNNFVYNIPDKQEITEYHAFLEQFPDVDSPEIFGLHPNADLTFRVKEVNAALETMGETQPKQSGGGGGGGASREDIVYEKAGELLTKLPPDFQEDDYKASIEKLGGLSVPLNIFLFQEIQRLQNVIGSVRHMLTTMQQAIDGEVVMTTELLNAMNDLFDAKVPRPWLYTPGGDEFSWLSPTLGLWFQSLLDRTAQNTKWLAEGRPTSYWITGFFNPQGFLTAVKQEVTRAHKADKWALDDVIYSTEITNHMSADNVRSAPSEGVFIYGLSLEGAAWSRSEGSLVESEPKKLFVPIPVLHVSATQKQGKGGRAGAAGGQSYSCPCYVYPARTDRFLIFMVNMPTKKKPPQHWVLRGVALLAQTQ